MTRSMLMTAAALAALIASPASAQKVDMLPKPPVTDQRPHSYTTHGITIEDPWAWLRDARLVACIRVREVAGR